MLALEFEETTPSVVFSIVKFWSASKVAVIASADTPIVPIEEINIKTAINTAVYFFSWNFFFINNLR